MLLARGFTLTELMMALTISGAFFVSATGISLGHLKRQTVLQHKLALMEEVTLLKQAVSTELRRAGYVHLPLTEYMSAPEALQVFGTVHIDAHPGEANQSCILFSYDKNQNGRQDASLPAEKLGFRLKNKAIEYRIAGRHCRQSGWQDLSSPEKITITNFHVDGPHRAILGAFFTITLSAQSVDAPSLQQRLRFSINAPNIPYE